MSNTSDKIDDMWKEIVNKEQLKNILMLTNEIQDIIKDNQIKIQEMLKQELTKLWNTSEIPTFKIIIEKLNLLVANIDKGKRILEENSSLTTERNLENKNPEIVSINVWKRSKEPILVDISEMKPKIPTKVNDTLDILANLHKRGKF